MANKRNKRTGQFESQPVEKRFWAKVDKRGPNDCWLWLASKDNCDYGMFWMNKRTIHASRAAWMLANGPVPNGMNVCHSCDTPGCVNPDHLFLGNDLDNHQDRAQKGRSAVNRTFLGKTGTLHPRAVLSASQVREVRKARQTGKNMANLARNWGVSSFTVYRAATGKSYQEIE